MRLVLWGLVSICGCTSETGLVGDGGADVIIDADTADAPIELPRHEAHGLKAYLGTLHDHHYGKNAGDDGGLLPYAAEEPGETGSDEWWEYRREHPEYYEGGDATGAWALGRENGLDFMAVTPHNHLIDNEEYGAVMSAAAEASGIIALFGQEWSSVSSGNHATVMNVSLRVTVDNGDYSGLLDSWLPGYVAGHPIANTTYAARPFLILDHPALEEWNYYDEEKERLEYGIDDYATKDEWVVALGTYARLVELMAGDGSDESGLDRVLEILNDGLKVGFSVGPDNHRQLWGERNYHRVGALASSWTKEAISEALYARRTYVSDDSDLGAHLAVLDDGEVLGWMGEELVLPGSTMILEIGLVDETDPTASYELEVLVDDSIGGDSAQTVNVDGPQSFSAGTIEVSLAAPSAGSYVIVHVTSSQGRDLWFSPIWIL